MLTEYRWAAIGGPQELTDKCVFVNQTVRAIFEKTAGISWKKGNGRIRYPGGQSVSGWHIYGISLKKVVRKDQVESTDE